MTDFAYAPGYDAAQALENALSYRVGVEKAGWGHLTSSFLRETRRTLTFRSGAEGSRTPDLRRAKAIRYRNSTIVACRYLPQSGVNGAKALPQELR
jgi:hypothetical protein